MKKVILLIGLVLLMPLVSAFSLKGYHENFRYDPKCWDSKAEYQEWYDTIAPHLIEIYEKYGFTKVPMRECDMPEPYDPPVGTNPPIEV